MKSRDLRTHHDVIISGYTISPLSTGKYLHQFTPATTDTIYQFEANSAPVLVNGDRYNIGFTLKPDGRRVVEPSAMGKADSVNKILSLLAAKQQSSDDFAENKAKNDQRVTHQAKDGYYWGKKVCLAALRFDDGGGCLSRILKGNWSSLGALHYLKSRSRVSFE